MKEPSSNKQESAGQVVLCLDRRQFLLFAGGTILAAGPLSLIGCGGGGGGGASHSLPTKVTSGQVVLPSGVSIPGLTVTGPSVTSKLAATGKFSYKAVVASPMYVAAVAPSGQIVLLGLLDDTNTTLDVNATAKALAYNALGVGAFIYEAQQIYMAAITAPGALTNIAQAITASMQKNGASWMSTADAGLESALQTFVTNFSPPGAGSVDALSKSKSALAKPAGMSFSPNGAVFNPTERTSGLQLQADGIGHATMQNFNKRQVWIYVDRVSYQTKDEEGVITTVSSPAKNKEYPIKLPAIYGATEGFLVALGQLWGGQGFYQPTQTEEIEVGVEPEAETTVATNYTLMAVGFGTSVGDSALLTETQKEGQTEVAITSLFFDLILPTLIMGIVPISQHSIQAFTGSALSAPVLQDILRLIQANNEINEAVEEGKPVTALYLSLVLIFNSETLLTGLLEWVMDLGLIPFGAFTTQLQNIQFGVVAAETLHAALSILNVATQALDSIITGMDMLNSQLATQFTLTSTKATVKMNPLNPFIDWPVQQAFSLTVTDASITDETLLTYQWYCASTFGAVTDPTGQTTSPSKPQFNSSSKTATYAPAPSPHALGGDTETIVGVVVLGGSNKGVPLGGAVCHVTYNAAITPAAPTLNPGDQQTFTAAMSTNVPAGLQYIWSVSGGHGTVGGGIQTTTTTNTVVYTAGKTSGSDTLSLRVLDSSGNLVTQGSDTVAVAGGASVINPPTVTYDGPGMATFFNVTGTFPSGTTYKWSCKTGGLSTTGTNPPYPNKLTTTVAKVTYSVANPPADGSAATDTLSVDVVGPSGSVLVSGSASIFYGGTPFLVATYPYTAENNKLITGGVDATSLTNLMGDPSYLGLFYEFEDHSEGSFFGITISVPSGTFLAPGQSYPLSATNNITQLNVFAIQGAIVNQAPPIISGTLKINSEITSPAGNGEYIGYSFTLQYDDAPQCTANGVILQHS